MSSYVARKPAFVAAVLAGLIGTPIQSPMAQQQSVPDFSSNFAGWVGLNGGGQAYEAVPGRTPGPITFDPAHPFVPNGTEGQPSFRIADLSNPNLMPWVKDAMKKDIDEIMAGKKSAFTAQSSCVPAGVPFFMGYGGPDPIVFLQTPKEVWMIWTEDNQVRRVYLNVPHAKTRKPSWYGESVGHYEGDTLVIDTIGQNAKTVVDIYRTPHTEKLHVVERWRIIDGGKGMEAVFTVEDPGAFVQPWTAKRRYRRIEQDFVEKICAENNTNLFDYHMPTASKPDF
ncbi:MAG TPA: hypothetical protein VHT51_17840 [Micropepsaceae bacterium]|nr:hypothetical protein [Micropepsaceae bacterium]